MRQLTMKRTKTQSTIICHYCWTMFPKYLSMKKLFKEKIVKKKNEEARCQFAKLKSWEIGRTVIVKRNFCLTEHCFHTHIYNILLWISSKAVTWNQTVCVHTDRKLNQMLKDATAYIVTDNRSNRNLSQKTHSWFQLKIKKFPAH